MRKLLLATLLVVPMILGIIGVSATEAFASNNCTNVPAGGVDGGCSAMPTTTTTAPPPVTTTTAPPATTTTTAPATSLLPPVTVPPKKVPPVLAIVTPSPKPPQNKGPSPAPTVVTTTTVPAPTTTIAKIVHVKKAASHAPLCSSKVVSSNFWKIIALILLGLNLLVVILALIYRASRGYWFWEQKTPEKMA